MLYVNPEFQNAKSLYTTRQDILSSIDDANNATNILSDLQKKYNSFPQVGIDNISKMVPDSASTVHMAYDLSVLAQSSGVIIKSIKSGTGGQTPTTQAKVNNAFNTNSYSISIDANYNAFKSFLLGMERSLRLIDITQILLKPNDNGIYTISMSFNSYTLK